MMFYYILTKKYLQKRSKNKSIYQPPYSKFEYLTSHFLPIFLRKREVYVSSTVSSLNCRTKSNGTKNIDVAKPLIAKVRIDFSSSSIHESWKMEEWKKKEK